MSKHPDGSNIVVPEYRIPGHVFFQTEEHVAFSPATQGMSLENFVLIVALIKMSKSGPEGMKLFKEIAIKYLDSCARIVESVEDACHSNWLTALNNQHIAASIAHRIGLIDDGSYIRIMDHYTSVFNHMIMLIGITDTIGSVSTLVQGSKAAGGETGIGALAAILKGMGV